MSLSSIHIILVEPSHPGNIGSSARVMKTMGIDKLSLVRPKSFPHPDAVSLAAGADSVLEECQVYESLSDALQTAQFVLGCSARKRTLHHEVYSPEAAAQLCLNQTNQEIAIVFGNERRGLTNEQLQLCHAQICIPTHQTYRSINLAQAVQIISYVFAQAYHKNPPIVPTTVDTPASFQELENFYQHLDQTLEQLGFFQRPDPKPTQVKLHHLFKRCQLKQTEVAMLRGLLSSIDKVLD